jgi:hypothetical protein
MMIQTVRLAKTLEQALRAPSVHNTQPWRWQLRGDGIELFADFRRQLPTADPDGRDLLISCGAALHHFLVVLAHQGHDAYVKYLPDTGDAGHLATVTVGDSPPEPATAHLFEAINRRHTERHRLSHRPVPEPLLATLADAAGRFDAQLVATNQVRAAFAAAFAEAAGREPWTPSRTTELRIWSHDHASARDRARAIPNSGLDRSRPPMGVGPADDAAEFLLLTTAEDRTRDRLRVGEALSSLLLTATKAGLATTPLSLGSGGEMLRLTEGITEYPQLVVRVGWPVTRGTEFTRTPRRDLSSILTSR